MKSKVKKKTHGLRLVSCTLWLLPWVSNLGQAQSTITKALPRIIPTEIGARNNPSPNISSPVRGKNTGSVRQFCYSQNIEALTNQLLHDLPNYANRAIQRARPHLLSKTPNVYSYVLVAGKPEITPLPPQQDEYSSLEQQQDVKQVFFTTLERLYVSGKSIDLQQFHRLFLTKTNTGWRLVMMFSQTGYYPANKPPTPPQDTTNGDIAQAINTWLRDCRAGSLDIRSAN
jgi:hypothetical protein